MSIVFKGTDLKQQFVVVKYKYKKRLFLPKWGSRDDTYYGKAQLFNTVEDAQKAINERRANKQKRHKYKIESADTYFGYNHWSFRSSYATPLIVEMYNGIEPVERSMKKDQKELITKAKDSYVKQVTEDISRQKAEIERKQKEIKDLELRIVQLDIVRNEVNTLDANALADQYKTKSEDMAAILFTGKDEY